MEEVRGLDVELSTYFGSGSFYASGYSDPYASLALYVKPTYDLGTRFNLSLRARIYFEEELTLPDNPTGRRFNPYDPWLWLAGDLHTFERSKIKIGGVFRTVLPVAYESRYRHDIITLAAGGERQSRLRIRPRHGREAEVVVEADVRVPVLQAVPEQPLPRQRPGRHHGLHGARRAPGQPGPQAAARAARAAIIAAAPPTRITASATHSSPGWGATSGR